MTRLERRYRSLLRLLPPAYRAEREEEMIGTVMADRNDELDLEYGWPGWPEAWAVAVLAVRTRLAGPGGPPRAAAHGDTVRLVALLGLLVSSVMAVAAMATWLSIVWRPAYPADVVPDRWIPAATILGLAAVGAFVLLVLGYRLWAKGLALVAVLPSLVEVARALPRGPGSLWTVVAYDAMTWITVGCLFAGFHREAPAPAARPWLRALTTGVGLAVVAAAGLRLLPLTGQTLSPLWLVPDLRTLFGWMIIIAATVCLVAPRLRDRGLVGPWALALAVCAVAILPERINFLAELSDLSARGDTSGIAAAVVLGQVASLAALVVVLIPLGTREVRKLPPTATPLAG
ncbi:MAG: hypothetical protein JOZ47_12815 [Kutzneria sp.]|nr:hypothetical protein [Kutzneria sp.]